jgi:hypothetical protein
MTSLDVVHLTWVDSESLNEWTHVDELTGPLSMLHAVGFLVHQNTEFYVLCVSYDPLNECANGVMAIPRACVKSVQSLSAVKVD